IWPFGCVLFEMLTGRRCFDPGDSVSDAIAAILKNDPDWTVLPPDVPQGVRRLLARCLEKDPKKRLRDIGEARIAIDESGGDAAAGMSAPISQAAAPKPWA